MVHTSSIRLHFMFQIWILPSVILLLLLFLVFLPSVILLLLLLFGLSPFCDLRTYRITWFLFLDLNS